MDCLLGVDVGTSSTKGALVSLSGELIATAVEEHQVSMPRPGWAEQDPCAVWWSDTVRVCRRLLSVAPGPVVALAPSGIGPVVAVADENGRPLRPAILYGIDTRATAEIEQLNRQLSVQAIVERSGTVLTSQATGPKFRWLANHEPELYQRARKTFMASSFLVWQLTGEYVLDHHSASQSVPLYDRTSRNWADDWFETVAPHIESPRLAWPAEVVGHVTERAAAETGLQVGTPVCCGTIDAWSEAVSVGADRPGRTMLMYGSTMFIVATADLPMSDSRLWGTVGTWPGTWCLAAGMATSGSLAGWFKELAGGVGYEELATGAESVPAGSRGLVTLPYFAGERTPIFDPDARGLIAGLTLRHGRAEIYRSILEATAYGVRHNLEVMAEAGADLSYLVAVGGGTTGGLWTRIVSDVTGRSQMVRRHAIGAAFGDARLAGIGIGRVDPESEWNSGGSVTMPEMRNRSLYDELYGVYRSLYEATLPQAHALARLQQAVE
ncbi:MAG: FGGY-family carbohydrate kinase [Actinomycetota bacterium]|nr:FGGY-family carbohydrate kinase [Actinomycetota bacterium]